MYKLQPCSRARLGGGRSPPAAAALHPVQIRVKCNEDDTIGDLKKLVAAQTGEGSCACFVMAAGGGLVCVAARAPR